MKTMSALWKIVLLTYVIIFALPVSALELGFNYEKDCYQGTCTINLYSYQKYYLDNGIWTFLNESFDTTNCNNYAFCVDNNLHQVYISSSSLIPSAATPGGSFSIGLYSLAGETSFTKNLQVKGSVATYNNILPGISLQYQYLAHEVKEMIVIDSQQSLLSQLSQGSKDLTLLFQLDAGYSYSVSSQGASIQKNGKTISQMLPVIVYDNETSRIGSYPYTVTTISGQQYLQVDIPITNLTGGLVQYPITIDPTFLINTTASEDYHINEALGSYTREDTTDNLPLGRGQTVPTNPVWSRGAWNFSLSLIPQNATITEAYLNLTVWSIGDQGNEVVEFHHMEKNLSAYPDTSNGNRDLSIDAGNGTIYNTTNFSIVGTGTKTLNFSASVSHIQNTKGEFSFGALTQGESGSGTQAKTKTRPSEYSVASERPVLIIKYNLTAASESEGDAAIVQGILNAIPNTTIHDSQQVYTRNATGTQQLGRFDKFAVFGNQRWAINYVTPGESFTNMNNLSTTFFVVEMTDLTASQITAQVQSIINGTKSP